MVPVRGFSLIEVLLALLVMAIGVLGILALQLVGLRATRETILQSSALRLATDIAEQIGGSTQSTAMLQVFAQFDYVVTDATTDSSGACYGVDRNCTPDQLAIFVTHQWQQRLRETLPGGRIRICRDAAPWQAASKSMRWECDGASNNNDATTPLWIKVGWRTASASAPSAPQVVLPVAAFAH